MKKEIRTTETKYDDFIAELENDCVESTHSPKFTTEETKNNVLDFSVKKRQAVVEDPDSIFNADPLEQEQEFAAEQREIALKHSVEQIKEIVRIKDRLHFNEALKAMQKKYSIINRFGSTYVLSIENDYEIYSDSSNFSKFFEYLYLDEQVPNSSKIKTTYLTDAFFKSPYTNRLYGLVLDPSMQPGVNAESRVYNKWKGWNYKAKKGDVSMFLRLVRVNAGNDESCYQYLINYLAHYVQKPWEKPNSAICVTGDQGAGKGALWLNTIKLLSKNTHVATSMQNLCTGQFNAEQSSSVFYIGDEITFSGNIQDAESLKNFITEDDRVINEKGKSTYVVKSYTRLVLMSNNANITKIDKDDRRYCVCNVASDLVQDYEFFDKYFAWLKNGGFEAIMHYLMHEVDISNFDPRKIPQTKAKLDLKVISFNAQERFIFSLLEGETEDEGIFTNARVEKVKIFDMFKEYCARNKIAYIKDTDFQKTLNKIFNFDAKNVNWRRNWKNTNGTYYYIIGSRYEAKRDFALNYMKQDPSIVFTDYEEPIDKFAVNDSEVAEAFKK